MRSCPGRARLSLSWLLLQLVTVRGSRHSNSLAAIQCGAYEALYPTIYDQLLPFVTGITQAQVDLATRYYYPTGDPPKLADLKYNDTAAATLLPDDPAYPWSHPFFVKVVVKDGEFYLPGGRIPPYRHGYALTAHWTNGHLLMDLLNVTDKFGPFGDMEFFVSSGDFQAIGQLSEDNTTFPTFSSTGSKRFYDLVLPEVTTTQQITEPKVQVDWRERTNKVAGRYNLMCHRGGLSIDLRGKQKEAACVRAEFHSLGYDEVKNFDGILDVGLVGWTPDWVKEKPKEWMSPEDLEKAKYALCIDGGSTSGRLPSLLKGGQLVMLEDTSPLFSHFYDALRPWVHYVPVGRESYDDIFGIARWLTKHDNFAHRIAEQGQAFARKYLTQEASMCYTRKMLEELSQLFTYKPRPLPPQAITLREAVNMLQADMDWMRANPEPQDE